VALQHHVEHPLGLVRELVLAQPPDPLVRVDRHRPGGRLELPAEDLHERGLSRAVRPDEAVAVPAPELHRDVGEKDLRPELHGNAGSDDHWKTFGSRK